QKIAFPTLKTSVEQRGRPKTVPDVERAPVREIRNTHASVRTRSTGRTQYQQCIVHVTETVANTYSYAPASFKKRRKVEEDMEVKDSKVEGGQLRIIETKEIKVNEAMTSQDRAKIVKSKVRKHDNKSGKDKKGKGKGKEDMEVKDGKVVEGQLKGVEAKAFQIKEARVRQEKAMIVKSNVRKNDGKSGKDKKGKGKAKEGGINKVVAEVTKIVESHVHPSP
ncbi:hypothetical protein BGZ70_004852, partial [Mortierella alpina]